MFRNFSGSAGLPPMTLGFRGEELPNRPRGCPSLSMRHNALDTSLESLLFLLLRFCAQLHACKLRLTILRVVTNSQEDRSWDFLNSLGTETTYLIASTEYNPAGTVLRDPSRMLTRPRYKSHKQYFINNYVTKKRDPS